MFRDGHFKPKQKANILFNSGGLGDSIAYLSAVKYIKDNFKAVEINLFVPNYFMELANHLLPGINVRSFSDGHKFWDSKVQMRQTKHPYHTTMRTHIVDHGFNVLCDKQPEIKDKNYCQLNLDLIDISHFNLPKEYVVITTGFTAPVREMLPDVINQISQYIISKGMTPVFLGSKEAIVGDNQPNIIGSFKEEIDYTLGIDLINKTNLLEAGKIIAESQAIVGIDNGLLHLAGCSDVPIVAGFTTVDPTTRLPYRHNQLGWNCYTVVPDKSLKCRFCQSNWDFLIQDMRYCFYKDYKCTKMVPSNKYIEQLELILNKSTCKDCGVKTNPGPGSGRCPECWNSRFGE